LELGKTIRTRSMSLY